jgi:hypothetical protein
MRMGRRVKTGSLLLLAVGVAGAAATHRATHGVWFPRRPAADWPSARADPSAQGWTAWNPIPIGPFIRGVRGERPDDVWAWSDAGIMHWDGRTWTRVLRPPRGVGSIAEVGESSGTLWVRLAIHHPARAEGCMIVSDWNETHDWCRIDGDWHLEGCPAPPAGRTADALLPPVPGAFVNREELARLWSAHPHDPSLPPIRLERGYRVGGGEVWAVDRMDNWLAHFDGKRWTAATNLRSNAIWLAAEDDGWLVTPGQLHRWDGRDWKPAASTPDVVQSIWGSASDDVWAVGGVGLVMHFDGRRWSEQRLPGNAMLTSVSGRAPDDVWITGCDRTAFTAHWDGRDWIQESIAPSGELSDPQRNACPLLAPGYDRGALAAVGDRMFEFRGGRWRPTNSPPLGPGAASSQIVQLASHPAGGIWGAGRESDTGVLIYDRENNGIGKRTWLRPLVIRRGATDWAIYATSFRGAGANRIWVRGPDDVWVVGDKGLILHFEGVGGRREESGTDETLIGIHGAGRTIWVIGAEGALLRRQLSK